MSNPQAVSATVPIAITDAVLISTDVTEADYAAWSSGTTYALAERCIDSHKIYQSAQAANTNHAVTDTAWWVSVGPTNCWAVFDTSNSTQTVQADSMQYVLQPGVYFDTVALLNITDGTAIRLQMDVDGHGTVHDQTIYASKILTDSSWYAFLLGDKKSLSSIVFEALPAYSTAQITLDIAGQARLAVGVIVVGQRKYFGGGAHYGARVGIFDYSRKTTDEFGNTQLQVRRYAKRANFSMRLDGSEIDAVIEYLASIRATPTLWIGTNLYTASMIFGIYQNFEVTIAYVDGADCTLELLGLT